MSMSAIRRHLAEARDVRKTKRARFIALEHADRARRAMKIGWSKIEKGFDPAVLACEIKEFRRSSMPHLPKDGVCKLVKELLVTTDLSYPEIVQYARMKFPSSSVSTKSVASLKRDLLREGVVVASRKTKNRIRGGGSPPPSSECNYAI